MTLSIPVVGPDDDTLGAALAYAAAGWYVLPVSIRARKNPGSIVGRGWQHQSSRDPDQIAAWFAGSSHLLALHVGRSGAVVADVDDPCRTPELLHRAVAESAPPHQSSRPDQPGRGHYAFAQPAGRGIGNSTGTLGKGWGEIRGRNGVILVAPSVHAAEQAGARYEWLRTGPVPELPGYVAELLPDATGSTDAATDAELARFVAEHTLGTHSHLAQGPVTRFDALVAEGASRHEVAVETVCWAARETMVGLYPAAEVFAALAEVFVAATGRSRDGRERVVSTQTGRAEFSGIAAWAVAQAEHEGPAAVRARLRERGRLTETVPPTRAALVGMLRKVLNAPDDVERARLARWATGKLRGYAAAGVLDPVYVSNVVEQLHHAAAGDGQ